MAKFAVILPAAGESRRFADKNYKKPFAPLDGRPVFMHAAERFVNRGDVRQTLLVVSPDDRDYIDMKFAGNLALLGIELVEGGAARHESVQKALARLKPEIEFVAVHDAVRPCLAGEWIDRVFAAAQKTGAAILGTPITATLKRVGKDGTVVETVPRDGLWEAQTPQVFRRDWLMEAYAQRGDFAATDDAQLVERAGHRVTVVQGSPINLKITTREDLRLAEQALKALPKPKVGGALHPFAEDDLWR